MLLQSETKIEPDLRLPNYKLFHISKKGTYSGSAISSSKQLSRWNWEHTESLFCSFVPLISSLVFIAGRNAMLRSPYLLTDQHLHSPTPVVPSISAPSTPLRPHGISSVDNVSSVLQKGTWRFYNGHALKKKFISDFRFGVWSVFSSISLPCISNICSFNSLVVYRSE